MLAVACFLPGLSKDLSEPLVLHIRTPSQSPSQAKVLTEGGDLREAQVDIPLSVIHTCV